jgi:glycosyltransferase involved in cell wall biosynthesis
LTHVLFVTGEYPPMPGGVGAYTRELAKALRALDVRITVLTSQHAADRHYLSDGACLRVLPVIQTWDVGSWRTVSQLAHAMAVDWLHVQYQTAAYAMHPAINFAPRRWRGQGLQVAWTYHDLLAPYLFPKAGQTFRRWVTEQPGRTAQCTIVTNEGDRQRLAQRGIAATNIPIGSNVAGCRLTPTERAAERAAYGYAAKDLVIAYFGFLNRSKGGLALVRTLQRLVQTGLDAHLLMVGEQVGASDATNFAYLQEVERLIERSDLTGRVRWTGNLPDAAVSLALNAADVLLMPYLDGASLRRGTLMAGLANGCAIVTTWPQDPLPELVHERDLVYVPAEDAAAMAAAVIRLAHDAPLRARLQSNARHASEQFGWAEIARRHLEIYATGIPRESA